MVKTSAVIKNEKGIHVRPSGIIFKEISGYEGKITVDKDGFITEIRDIISILTLGLAKNNKIEISIDGPDEENMLEKVKGLFEQCYQFAEV